MQDLCVCDVCVCDGCVCDVCVRDVSGVMCACVTRA